MAIKLGLVDFEYRQCTPIPFAHQQGKVGLRWAEHWAKVRPCLEEHEGVSFCISLGREIDHPFHAVLIGQHIEHQQRCGEAKVIAIGSMDVILEDVLVRAFSSTHADIPATASRTLLRVVDGGKERVQKLEKHQDSNDILTVVQSNLMFTLADKYRALSRVSKALGLEEQVKNLNSQNIIDKRNLLAHAREAAGQSGTPTLKSIKDGHEIEIDDAWMTELRTELRVHRLALQGVCAAIDAAIA